jgi:ubiquinone/menaquinone biosynthesis C-methylase UbiE
MATNANAEATQAWDGPLFERFVEYRHLIVAGLANHGEKALALHPPPRGARVLDVGCGFGDTTERLAALVGPDGSAHGVDVAPRFIQAAREEVKAPNASFEVRDVQFDDLGGPYDYVFSRMGVMFFANPGAAMRNIRASMSPGGRLNVVVWRIREDNPWMYDAQLVVERLIGRPKEYDEPTCGPGPFSMANADTLSQMLIAAGFAEIGFERLDLPLKIGNTIDEAIEFNLALGPAAEAVRLAGDEGDALRPRLAALLREALADLETPEGEIVGSSSVWIVTARAAD